MFETECLRGYLVTVQHITANVVVLFILQGKGAQADPRYLCCIERC